MKKFYALALAAAVALSASAYDFNVAGRQLQQSAPVKSEGAHMKVVTSMKKISDKAETGMEKAPRKAVSASDLVGSWEFYLGDYYFQDSTNGTLSVEFECSLVQGNKLMFEDPTNYELPFVGDFDETAGTITFQRLYLGQSGSYYIYQNPFEYNYTTNDLDDTDLVGTYNEATSTLTFKADHGLAWEAYGDQAASSKRLGYFSIYDFEGATKGDGSSSTPGEGEDDGDWIDLGEASFEDAWVLPGYNIERTDPAYVYNVPLQRSATDANLYRLVDPYHAVGFPLPQANTSTKAGYIMIDVTDPAAVVINGYGVPSGFANSQTGSAFYCYNALGMYAASGYDPSFVLSVLGDEMPLTTFENGVVTLSYYDGEDGREYDANFGIQSAPDGGYQWTDSNRQPVDMTGKIVFPAGWDSVSDILVEDNAPARYYNLQGVEVLNPSNGIYIKVAGKTASKVYVK